MIGQHKLHPNLFKLAAGNMDDDNAIVNPMSTALISRFAHFYLELNHKEWMEWAAGHIDIRITSFIGRFPKYIYTFDPDATTPYACPRTLEMLSDTTDGKKLDSTHKSLVSSLLGEGVATEFLSFLTLYKSLHSFEDIINDPEGLEISSNMSIRWAIMGLIAHNILPENAKACAVYLGRFPPELQICALREIKARQPNLLKKELKDWILSLARHIY